MARVPTYDSFQVSQNTLPNVPHRKAQRIDTTSGRMQQTGQALSYAGQHLGQAATRAQEQVNTVRQDGALNQVKEEAMRLAHDQNEGFTNLRGHNALERPDGKPLTEEYGERLQQYIASVSAGLGNDAQRAAFTQASQGILTNFRGDLMKHESAEFRTYALSVSEGVQATALREVALSWDNPEAVDKAVHRIRAHTYQQAQMLGKSAEWQDAEVRRMVSAAHTTALAAALENNHALYADSYLSKYAKDMEADDILRMQGQITKTVDLQVGDNIGANVFATFAPDMAPNDFSRLTNIVMNIESGGRRYDPAGYGDRTDGSAKGSGWLGELSLPDGGVATEYTTQSDAVKVNGERVEFPTLVPTLSKAEVDSMVNDIIPNTKPIPEPVMQKAIAHAKDQIAKGDSPFANSGKLLEGPQTRFGTAKGEMQVLDGTNADPGYGVTPAQDGSPEERARVGRDYLAAMLKEYKGDVAKALAAYNWGPGNTDAAIKRHGPEWLNHAPSETRNYVASALNRFGAGAGATAKPSLAEMKAALREQPELANNPARLKHAEDRLESNFKDENARIEQREDEALDAAYKELAANGGDYANLSPAIRMAIPGDKIGNVMSFADKVRTRRHSPEAWAQILSLPSTELAKLTPIEFYRQFYPVLDDVHLQKGYAILEDAQGVSGENHLEIITTATRVKNAAIVAGILPDSGTPDKKEIEAFSNFTQTVESRLRQFERVDLEGKRKANSEELQSVIDGVFLDQAFVQRWFNWAGREAQPVALMDSEDQARAYVIVDGEKIPLTSIPIGPRAALISKLQARGMPVTEQAIAEMWVVAGKPK